jgi:hypothetical protein
MHFECLSHIFNDFLKTTSLDELIAWYKNERKQYHVSFESCSENCLAMTKTYRDYDARDVIEITLPMNVASNRFLFDDLLNSKGEYRSRHESPHWVLVDINEDVQVQEDKGFRDIVGKFPDSTIYLYFNYPLRLVEFRIKRSNKINIKLIFSYSHLLIEDKPINYFWRLKTEDDWEIVDENKCVSDKTVKNRKTDLWKTSMETIIYVFNCFVLERDLKEFETYTFLLSHEHFKCNETRYRAIVEHYQYNQYKVIQICMTSTWFEFKKISDNLWDNLVVPDDSYDHEIMGWLLQHFRDPRGYKFSIRYNYSEKLVEIRINSLDTSKFSYRLVFNGNYYPDEDADDCYETAMKPQ